MVKAEIKTVHKPAVFTDKKRRVIIARAVSNRRFSLNQRCFLESSKTCNAGILAQLLRDYFPGLIFIPKHNAGTLTILNYVVKKDGQWTLNIKAMSKSKEKIFSCLFPNDISPWDENKARKKYGCADVIKFFIDAENDKFFAEFTKLKDAELATIDTDTVPGFFFKELDNNADNYYGKPVWEEWDFSGLVLHKMRHNPPSIYEAYGYYGHKNYTLLGFGLQNIGKEKQPAPNSHSRNGLLKEGNKLIDTIVLELLPEMAKMGIERRILLFELIQEVLESVPVDKSIYAPTESDVFIKQLKSRIPNLFKKNHDINYEETFNSSERKTINNHVEKIDQYIDDEETLSEIRKLKLEGTYQEKINMIHRLIMRPAVREHYSRREFETIHGLFLKQFQSLSLDKQLGDDEDTGSFSAYDIIYDEKYMQPDSHFVLTVFFKNAFEQEFDENNLEKFLECLPGHFEQYPFVTDSTGNIQMSKYSKRMLFSTFCSIAGIPADNELWKPFLILMQQVIDDINKSNA